MIHPEKLRGFKRLSAGDDKFTAEKPLRGAARITKIRFKAKQQMMMGITTD